MICENNYVAFVVKLKPQQIATATARRIEARTQTERERERDSCR